MLNLKECNRFVERWVKLFIEYGAFGSHRVDVIVDERYKYKSIDRVRKALRFLGEAEIITDFDNDIIHTRGHDAWKGTCKFYAAWANEKLNSLGV